MYLEFQKFMLEVGSGQRYFAVPPFNPEIDLPEFLLQLINGAFGTFPYTSMAYYCKTNTTSIYPTGQIIYDTFSDSWVAMKIGVRAV
jgi:hypothetical protein